MTRKPALLRRDTRMVIDAGVRPRPCTTMTDSAPSGGEDEQANKIHRSAQVSATWSLPQCVRKRFKALFEGARRYDDWRSDDHVYSRKRQGLHLPIPGRGSQGSGCRNVQGYDGHTTLKGDVKHALLQRSRWPTGSVRGDERRVPILEVRHQLVRRPASVVPRRSEDEPLHTEHAQKHGNRLRVPGRMLHPRVRPMPKIGRKTRSPSLKRQRARLVPLAEDVVRLGRDVLLTRHPNGYGQTQQQQEREPERPQHIPVDEKRTSEYERDAIYAISTEQISSPLSTAVVMLAILRDSASSSP